MDAAIYVIEGGRVQTFQDFFDLTCEAVGGPGHYFGKNLDAFSDCLSGGYGTPDNQPYEFVLSNASNAREALGFKQTLIWLHQKLERCHPGNREIVRAEIAEALVGRGPTLFDTIIDIFEQRDIPLNVEHWGVVGMLEHVAFSGVVGFPIGDDRGVASAAHGSSRQAVL